VENRGSLITTVKARSPARNSAQTVRKKSRMRGAGGLSEMCRSRRGSGGVEGVWESVCPSRRQSAVSGFQARGSLGDAESFAVGARKNPG